MKRFSYYITSRKYGPKISIPKYEEKRIGFNYETPGPGYYNIFNLTNS